MKAVFNILIEIEIDDVEVIETLNQGNKTEKKKLLAELCNAEMQEQLINHFKDNYDDKFSLKSKCKIKK